MQYFSVYKYKFSDSQLKTHQWKILINLYLCQDIQIKLIYVKMSNGWKQQTNDFKTRGKWTCEHKFLSLDKTYLTYLDVYLISTFIDCIFCFIIL